MIKSGYKSVKGAGVAIQMKKLNRDTLFNRLRNITKEQYIFYGQIMLMIAICIVHALTSGHYANFVAINGTFQNYNPVRRFLAGQIPYRDFQDYLGMGHLYSGAVTTILFGGDYQGSLMAFSFLSILGFALLGVILGMAIFPKRTTAVGATNILLILLITQPFFWINALQGTDEMREAMNVALKTGVSARFVRGLVIPFTCFLCCLCYALWIKMKEKFPNMQEKYFVVVAIGGVAAFSFIWSNDYGISCWVCLQVMFFVVVCVRTRKFWTSFFMMVIEILISSIWIFILVEIFTLGHFKGWLNSIVGTGGYQSWYYNIIDVERSYFVFDVDFSFMMLLQAFLCLTYLIKLCKTKADKQALIRFGMPAFINMVCFCAVNEYRLLSGAFAYEIALTSLFFSIVFEVCHHIVPITNKIDMQKLTVTVSLIVSFAWIISDLKDEFVFWTVEEKEGVYVDEMGGYVTNGKEILDTSKFLDGNETFATYSSAQEVVENKFQPSGIDYIIHVLGDSAREEYLEKFNQNNFKYAATIIPQYSAWEQWIMRANWFWYRELYEKWHPVYANSYEMYWERNGEDEFYISNTDYKLNIEQLDAQTVKIAIQASGNVNGIADVRLNYAVKKSNRFLSKMIIQPMLKIVNTANVYTDQLYESNNLRESGEEYIPISVINGYGEITLTSQPVSSTYLEVYECSVGDIYMVPYAFVRVENVLSDEKETLILIDNNGYTADETSGVTAVVIDGKQYNVSERRVDDSYLYLVINTDEVNAELNNDMLKNGNMIRIMR